MTTTEAEHHSPGWVADDSTFGARLALVRQQMGWGNVKEAADACGIPVQSWRSWERDNVEPRGVRERAWKIAERTGCDYGWLLDGPRLRYAVPAVSTEPRVLTKRRKEDAATPPNVFYPATAERTGCVPDRSRLDHPTPASQGSPRLSPTVNHTGATHTPGPAAATAKTREQHRARRRYRPTT